MLRKVATWRVKREEQRKLLALEVDYSYLRSKLECPDYKKSGTSPFGAKYTQYNQF